MIKLIKKKGGYVLIPLAQKYIRNFPIQTGKKFLFKQFFWRHRILTSHTNFNFKMKGKTDDLVQGYIYYFGIWEPNLTYFMKSRLTDNKSRTFIDVGANVGYFSLLASSQLKFGKVVAIEAFPKIYDKLLENITINKYNNIRTVNMAATDEPCSISMYYANIGNEGGTTSIEGKYETEAVTVSGLPLSDILSDSEIKTARIIKIDTEGAECSVIKGMSPILDKMPKDVEIVVEINPNVLTGDETLYIFNAFKNAGFFPYKIYNGYAPEDYLPPLKIERPERLKGLPETIADVIFSRLDNDFL